MVSRPVAARKAIFPNAGLIPVFTSLAIASGFANARNVFTDIAATAWVTRLRRMIEVVLMESTPEFLRQWHYHAAVLGDRTKGCLVDIQVRMTASAGV